MKEREEQAKGSKAEAKPVALRSSHGKHESSSAPDIIARKFPRMDGFHSLLVKESSVQQYSGSEVIPFTVRDLPDRIQLTDSICFFPRKRISEQVFVGERTSALWGVRPIAAKMKYSDENTLREIEILNELGVHQNIVFCIKIGSYCPRKMIYLAMELCHEQNLQQYTEERKKAGEPFDNKVAIQHAKQLVAGLTHIHKSRIVHCDLKPDNILFSLDQKNLKISDFGLSRKLDRQSTLFSFTGHSDIDGYRAPELITTGKFSEKADIFSLGSVLHYICSYGEHPYGSDPQECNYHVKKNLKPDFSTLELGFGAEARNLLAWMLQFEPEDRPSIQQVENNEMLGGPNKAPRYGSSDSATLRGVEFQTIDDQSDQPKNKPDQYEVHWTTNARISNFEDESLFSEKLVPSATFNVADSSLVQRSDFREEKKYPAAKHNARGDLKFRTSEDIKPQNLELKRTKDDFIATWEPPADHPRGISLSYLVKVFRDDKHVEEVTVQTCQHTIVSPEPMMEYSVVVGVERPGWGEELQYQKSEKLMICKRLGVDGVRVDLRKLLREDYVVYEGYMKGAAGTYEKIAVKILSDHERLKREIENMQQLKPHQNCVLCLHSGEFGELGNQVYIAMELCRRETFYEMVKMSKLHSNNVTIALIQVMHGLHHIHGKKILHRDLKPQNILWSNEGRNVKIADFGLSKKFNPDASKISKSILEVGTDGWGSPEHYKKDVAMSEESDIYSAGLVFFFALSGGKHAFGEEAYNWKRGIITNQQISWSALQGSDAEIERDLIMKMTAHKPEDRPTAERVLTHCFFWNEEKRMRFYHVMKDFSAPFFAKTSQKTPGEMAKQVLDEVQDCKGVIDTKSGEKNWFKKMQESKESIESDKNTKNVTGTDQEFHNALELIYLKADPSVKPKVKYDHSSVFDLIRLIRNVEEHRSEDNIFANSKQIWDFFYRIFPTLFCTVYNAVWKQWPQMQSSQDFPDAFSKFFTETAAYQPLVIED